MSAYQSQMEQLIAEHFGFVPSRLLDDIVNSTNSSFYKHMDELREFVEAESAAGDAEALIKGLGAAETLVESALDNNLDKWEIFVTDNIFAVPSGMSLALPDYEDITSGVSEQDEEALDCLLREEMYITADILLAKEEISKQVIELNSVLPQLRVMVKSLETLFPPSAESSLPPSADVESILEKYSEFHSIVKILEDKLKNGFLSSVLLETRAKQQHLASSILVHVETRRQSGPPKESADLSVITPKKRKSFSAAKQSPSAKKKIVADNSANSTLTDILPVYGEVETAIEVGNSSVIKAIHETFL